MHKLFGILHKKFFSPFIKYGLIHSVCWVIIKHYLVAQFVLYLAMGPFFADSCASLTTPISDTCVLFFFKTKCSRLICISLP